MGWKRIERNRMDLILTDLLPVELSELFSFNSFYTFLLEKKPNKLISELINSIKQQKAKDKGIMFQNSWSTKPFKYHILKGTNTFREMSIMQPLSAINLLLFMQCYQKDILNFFHETHCFSIRYHKHNTDLFYKSKEKKVTEYFQHQSNVVGKGTIQQAGNYFKISPFESINEFTGSHIWRMCNFKYKFYAKMDYKSCFDSIYTHSFSWIIERNVVDAKNAKNSHLFITIDRILQNINGRSSNGLIVGPEFSRMVAEILLQQIDKEIKISLLNDGIIYDKDYVVYRYVDDIFLFANEHNILSCIIEKYRLVGEQYLLRLNELKLIKSNTPCLPKEWLEKTRRISDIIGNFFFHGKKIDYDELPEDKRFLVKTDIIPIDRLKDEIGVLIKNYPDDKRTIVSFLLSTLLNNISKKKNGYTLFSNQGLNRARLLLDFTFYIYAYYPSFEQTRKLISIITYMDEEFNFKEEANAHNKLDNLIRQYAFIFQSGNLPDLCDWFPFFFEYKLSLDIKTERLVLENANKLNNPIIWANLLLYSQYYSDFFAKLRDHLETTILHQISSISEKDQLLQIEIWYVLVFHNCPYITESTRCAINRIIEKIKSDANKNTDLSSSKATILVCDFLQRQSLNKRKPLNSFFNWNGTTDFSKVITYRTYQRTLFKHYHKKGYFLYTSLD